jgi:urease accessory protein UreF
MNSNDLQAASQQLQAALQNNQLTAQQYNQYMTLLSNAVNAQQQGQIQGQQLVSQNNLGLNQIAAGAYNASAGRTVAGLLGGALQGAGSLAGGAAKLAAL